MLHSAQCNKATNEDQKTSSVFENLILLPDNEFWSILRSSCQDSSDLPEDVGLLKEYKFWPKWKSNSRTSNVNYVAPDVFFQFEKLDVIVEAKVGDFGGQDQKQWNNEYVAYLNEYAGKNRKTILIALGGNATMEAGMARDEVRQKKTKVYKCSWIALSNEVAKRRKASSSATDPNEKSARKRLFDNIKLAFSVHNVLEVHWFDELCSNQIRIRETSVDNIKLFQTREAWTKN